MAEEQQDGGTRPRRRRRWLWLLVPLVLLALGGSAVQQGWVRIPPNWQPWGPVTLDAEPSWFARLQINGLSADPQACYAALERSGLAWVELSERPIENGCGLEGGARIVESRVGYSSRFDATCAMIAALRWWEADLIRLGEAHLGSPVSRIDHLGSYACRNIGGGARRSQHATANALDVAGFRLADGRTVSVVEHWGDDDPRGRFLADARGAACGLFNAVLGPDYNAAHADHFHLDLGRFRACR